MSTADDETWGRVLICGGTNWPKLGRKDRPKTEEDLIEHPDLLEPHILRSLSNVKAASIHSSCAGCHFVVLDTDGTAWLFGRNGSGALGVNKVEAVSENAPRRIRPSDLGSSKQDACFVNAACGRNHTLLVASDGKVFSAGANTFGQCGHPACPEVRRFKQIEGFSNEHPVKASAGVSFSLVLAESGKIFSFGSGEAGQLGNGTTGERISPGKTAFDVISSPILVKDLHDKKIVSIASGQQHSAAIDSEGVVYVWGYNGYCRLGLGHQKDVLRPKPVPQFTGPVDSTLASAIVCGPTNTVVIDRQGMYWVAGKWKNSGEGSSGSPNTTFKIMQEIMGCKIIAASCGGVTSWAVTPDDNGIMTVAWGQNAANGELGLGPDSPKSATKPTEHKPLKGVEVTAVAAGQNTTLFLARPVGELFSELPRHPEEVEAPEACLKCNNDQGELLECEKCDKPYHLGCLSPPLAAIPDGQWFCPKCESDPGAPLPGYDPVVVNNAESDDAGDDENNRKRKADSDNHVKGKKARQ